MQAVADTNLVFALVNTRHSFHRRACAWLDSQPPGFRMGICRLVQMGLLRLLGNKYAMDGDPLTLAQSWQVYANLIGDPSVCFLPEPNGFQAKWIELCQPYGAAPKVVNDAYLAAVAIQLNLPVATFDQDFDNFPSVTVSRIP
jgi:toxin-antitoxin system PIN domain toxin